MTWVLVLAVLSLFLCGTSKANVSITQPVTPIQNGIWAWGGDFTVTGCPDNPPPVPYFAGIRVTGTPGNYKVLLGYRVLDVTCNISGAQRLARFSRARWSVRNQVAYKNPLSATPIIPSIPVITFPPTGPVLVPALFHVPNYRPGPMFTDVVLRSDQTKRVADLLNQMTTGFPTNNIVSYYEINWCVEEMTYRRIMPNNGSLCRCNTINAAVWKGEWRIRVYFDAQGQVNNVTVQAINQNCMS